VTDAWIVDGRNRETSVGILSDLGTMGAASPSRTREFHMQAGLLPPAGPAGSDLLITMLDGELGAVTPAEAVAISETTVCWCECVVCTKGPEN
jgi:hypothetical protein